MFNLTLINENNIDSINLITTLSEEIWKEHYASITSLEQVEYMLEKFFSFSSIKEQIKEKYEFYLLTYQTKPIGYISLQNKDNHLFLSKFYMLKSYRSKGLGKQTMEFIKDKAKKHNKTKIQLTVHKQNPTIKAYEAFGFKITKPIVTEIGNGYVMDDYIMELGL